MKRITQHQAIFYRLWRNRIAGGNRYIPIYEFIGEVFIEELGRWAYVSYEIPARMSEIFSGNPGLLARERVTGKSGALYYQYRIHSDATADTIADPDLRAFRNRLEAARVAKREGV